MRSDEVERAAATPRSARERPLKVTVFAHSSDLGGAERSLLELVKELKEDHQVCCMVLLPWPGPLESELKQVGIEHHVVPYCWWCASSQEDADRLGPALAAAAWAVDNEGLAVVRQFDPDVIMTMTMVIPWGALVAAELGKPHVWQVCEFGDIDHGLHFVFPLEGILESIRLCSDFIFTLSQYHRTYLFPDLGDDRCLPLYRHIEIPEAEVEESAEFFSRKGALRVGMFATILPSKGQADAVLAIADLVSRGWDVELLLAGYQADDAYLERLRGLVSENGLQERVRFPGVISEVYSAMRQADVVLVCSRQEAFGRVAIEALLAGRPVVYAEAAALPEIMVDGVTGLSYPPGEAGALADRIELLLRDKNRAGALARNGQAHAASRFSRDAFGGLAFRVLSSLTSFRVGSERSAIRLESLDLLRSMATDATEIQS